MTKFFVDANGVYVGGFDGAKPPQGTIEVASAPQDARQIWSGGKWGATAPSLDDYRTAIVSLLDAKAQERRYDNAVSIATYTGSKKRLDWKAEAEAFVDWREMVWDYAYAEFEKVIAGQRPQPTVEGFLAELPAMKWPAEALQE